MNKRKFIVSFLISSLVLFSVAGGVGLATFLYGTNLSQEVIEVLDVPVTDRANILLLGLDKGEMRSDVIMLVSIDPKRNSVQLMSIPRDTRVKVRSGNYDKINHTLGYKNPEETVIQVIREITGMPINYYCEIDFTGFRDFIDILGGVYFDVPVDMHYEDPAQNLKIHVNKGYQHLDGENAEGVVRFRNTYVNGDEGRIAVQQDFLKALVAQKLTPQYIVKAPELLEKIYECVKTNFSIADALSYTGILNQMTADSFETHQLPGTPEYMNNLWYYIYDEAETKQLIYEKFGYLNGQEVEVPTPSPTPAPDATPTE